MGFFLDTLEDELTALSVAGQPKASDEAAEQTGDGWLEVGKRNRAANTRSVGTTVPLSCVVLSDIRMRLTDEVFRVSDHQDIWR